MRGGDFGWLPGWMRSHFAALFARFLPSVSDDDIRIQMQPAGRPPAAGRTAPFGPRAWLPWIAAAGLALLAGWLLQAYVASRGELVLIRSQAALREVEGKALQQQIEAERILSARRVADLSDELHARTDPGQFQVVPLACQPDAALPRLAVVVLNPDRQEGELVLAGIPALPPDEDYQLWITDSEHPVAVSAAVFTINSMSGGFRVPFKLDQPRANAAGFTVSVERKGGATSRQGPVILSSR